ncbi:hypothetical protein RDI58_029201 [Solanum bulbocastanum]|uniref:Uncharacterized protein n=1 Tax=Solanum bulbocastanum TaxID=147425 RepID=A0AAN8STX4_SOLBU
MFSIGLLLSNNNEKVHLFSPFSFMNIVGFPFNLKCFCLDLQIFLTEVDLLVFVLAACFEGPPRSTFSIPKI